MTGMTDIATCRSSFTAAQKPDASFRAFSAEDTSEDQHVYEPMTCPVCHQVHYVNPATGKVLGEDGE